MDELRKKLIAKSSLPEGWGRSVVGGQEIVTRPSQKAVSNPLRMSDVSGQMDELNSEELQRTLSGYVPDLSGSLEPDSNGFVGDFHVDDLQEQYDELMGQSEDGGKDLNIYIDDLNAVNEGTYRRKALKNGMRYSEGEEEEAVRMLGAAVKFGRGVR